MKITYKPQGICAQLIEVEVTDGKITYLKITGGCNGNLQGLTNLVTGQDAQWVISKLEGIPCKTKPTSCPDQVAQALKKCIES